jgi:5-methylcytosine-specific restriction endonuclease McrA
MSAADEDRFRMRLDDWRAGIGPNPRPRKRTIDKDAGKSKCLGYYARCRLCGSAFDMQRHHLVPRSQSGDDVDANLVPLCGARSADCHRRITENDAAYLRQLRASLHPDELAYITARKGEAWLDSRYPA